MTTLADVRTRVRKDLHDTDATAYRWTDDQLDRHIARALTEVSLAIPQEKTATLATTSGSRDLSLASLTGLMEVEAAEFPTGEFPPSYTGFSRWAATLTLHTAAAPTGQNAKLYYTAVQVLDGAGTTLAPAHEDIVATGAGAYAALDWSSFATDRLNLAGDGVAERYAAWGRAAYTVFRQLLGEHARRRAVRTGRLYLPA